MADTILVVVEQREGKLNRVSWETITAGQAIAAATGWTLEAAVVGSNASAFAAEVAAKKVAKVYAVESPKLEPYTPDAFAAGAQAVPHGQAAQTRADAAHLSGARLRPQAGHCHGTHRHQRLHRLQARKRKAAFSPARCFRASSPPTSASPPKLHGSSHSRTERFAEIKPKPAQARRR